MVSEGQGNYWSRTSRSGRRLVLVVCWGLTVVLTGGTQAGQTNSLFLRGLEKSAGPSAGTDQGYGSRRPSGPEGQAAQAATGRAESRPVLQVSWIAVAEPSPKDHQVHDLITIIVHEVSKHATKAQAQSEREYDINAALKDWFRFTKDNLRPSAKDHGEPKFEFSFKREFDGSGDVSREDSLAARVQAEIIDILPNANLVLEATHSITTDDETTTITLTGTCRSRDVGVGNTILSSQLARLRLRKGHSGSARDATRRGLLGRLLDWLNLF